MTTEYKAKYLLSLSSQVSSSAQEQCSEEQKQEEIQGTEI